MTTQLENYKKANQRVVAAAIKNADGDVIVGARHFDMLMHKQLAKTTGVWKEAEHPIIQGFIDQFGEFLTREEAWVIAQRNNQIIRRVGGDDPKLYSENLY